MTQKSLFTSLSLLALIPLFGMTVSHQHIPAAKPNVVSVVATEYAFALPASIPAGLTTFEFQNHGKLLHHLSIARLDSGKSEGEAIEEMVRLGHNLRPHWMVSVGGANAAMPGQGTNATIFLEPGKYFAYCEIPGPDVARHYMHGMVKSFTVTPASISREALPTADITINMVDYAFVLSKPITPGHHVILVRDGATDPHMLAIKRYPIGYPAGTAANEIAAWSANPQGKPSPGYSVGGLTEIGPTGTGTIEADFEPGMYLLICFSAAPNGTPHFKLGMQQEITVK